MSDLFSLDGRVALVVGAAEGGLGAYAARALAEAGATRRGRRPGRSRPTTSPPRRMPAAPPPPTHAVDVTDADSVAALVDGVVAAHGRVDVLVACQGAMLRREIELTDPAEWQRVIDVNLTGTWLLDRAVLAPMRAQGYGRIVNVSTVYAERVGPDPGVGVLRRRRRASRT